MEELKAQNLVKTFVISEKQRKSLGISEKKKVAVDGVSFTARSGEVFGLIGPNGAGKTTTMRMLATLIKPDSGDALYNSVSAVKTPEKVRSELAFLTTDLKPDMKSTPNIMFDFFAELYHIPKDKAEKRKKELFAEFIKTLGDDGCGKLLHGVKEINVTVLGNISVGYDPVEDKVDLLLNDSFHAA